MTYYVSHEMTLKYSVSIKCTLNLIHTCTTIRGDMVVLLVGHRSCDSYIVGLSPLCSGFRQATYISEPITKQHKTILVNNAEMLMARYFKRQFLASNAPSLRNSQHFPSIRAHTNKFHKSFLPYCLRYFIQSLQLNNCIFLFTVAL